MFAASLFFLLVHVLHVPHHDSMCVCLYVVVVCISTHIVGSLLALRTTYKDVYQKCVLSRVHNFQQQFHLNLSKKNVWNKKNCVFAIIYTFMWHLNIRISFFTNEKKWNLRDTNHSILIYRLRLFQSIVVNIKILI